MCGLQTCDLEPIGRCALEARKVVVRNAGEVCLSWAVVEDGIEGCLCIL
jgi:hypothetical protein